MTTTLNKGAKVKVLLDNRSLPQEVEILNTPTTDATMEEYCSQTKGWLYFLGKAEDGHITLFNYGPELKYPEYVEQFEENEPTETVRKMAAEANLSIDFVDEYVIIEEL